MEKVTTKRPRNVKLQVKQRLCGSEANKNIFMSDRVYKYACWRGAHVGYILCQFMWNSQKSRFITYVFHHPTGEMANFESTLSRLELRFLASSTRRRTSAASIRMASYRWQSFFKLCMRSISRNHRLNLSWTMKIQKPTKTAKWVSDLAK